MTVRWGFLGAGFVASRAMAPAVHAANGAILCGVASRDEARSRLLEPERVHLSYEALLADDTIDAVYISLTNVQHYEWVLRSLRAGKDVLCEKPLAMTAHEAREMFAVAKECGRTLVEAVWVRWHPRFARMVEISRSGELGELLTIDTRFTSRSEMVDNYRLDSTLGGGALLDVGCYQAHTWLALAAPVSTNVNIAVINLEVRRDIGPTNIDLTTEAKALLNGTMRASMLSSFAMDSSQLIAVGGTAMSFRTGSGEAFTSWREECSLIVSDKEEVFASVDAFVLMTENVSARFEGGSNWVVPPHDSIEVAQLLDDIAATSDLDA